MSQVSSNENIVSKAAYVLFYKLREKADDKNYNTFEMNWFNCEIINKRVTKKKINLIYNIKDKMGFSAALLIFS